MKNINQIKSLLSQVSTITESYERINAATGNNFNIFSILNIEHYEESTHSRFIAELLKPSKSHGFGNKFAKAFFEESNLLKENFNFENYTVETEYYIGNVTEFSGGRIDILLKDNLNNTIAIENKIYAAEQPNQLLRYFNHNTNGKVMFLTLFGDESVENKNFTEYNSLSYKNHINNWLERCQELSMNNSAVRETIKQYQNLVKKLTHQNINNEMDELLLKLFTAKNNESNFDSYIAIKNIEDDVYKHIINEVLLKVLDDYAENEEITVIYDKEQLLNQSDWPGFSIQNKILSKYKIEARFSSHSKTQFNNFIFGFVVREDFSENIDFSVIQSKFYEVFGNCKTVNHWKCQLEFENFRDWNNPQTQKQMIFGEFQLVLKDKIDKLLMIANQTLH